MSNKELSEKKEGFLQEPRTETELIHSYPAYDVYQDDDDEIDLREVWQVIKRRKGTILSVAMLIFIAVALVTLLTPPTYRASVKIQINPEEATQVVNYDVQAKRVKTRNAKWFFYQTHYELLKSKALVRDVIDELDMEKELVGDGLAKPFWADNVESGKNWFYALLGRSLDEQSTDVGDKSPETIFLEDLTVEPVNNSRIVNVYYASKSAPTSMMVVNTLAEKYIEMNLRSRIEAASYAEDFLNEQLTQAKSQLQESEAELIAYIKQKDIINIGKVGTLDSKNVAELNQALGEAKRSRIEIETVYDQLKQSKSITRLQKNKVINALRETKAKLQGEYQEKLGVYKPAFPSMVQLQKRIKGIEAQIQQEINREVAALEADYLAAKQKENKLKSELGKQKETFLSVQDDGIQYKTLSREVETNRELYQGLLERLKEVGVAGSIGSNNITIVDRATVPFEQYKPNIKLNLVVGGAIGVFIGMVIAFLLEFFDNRVRTTIELENLLKVGTLGIIPLEKNTKYLPSLAATDPHSAGAEAYRSLRTNLQFSTSHGLPKSLLITSAMPSEGKSSVASNLAISLSQNGKSVLLIDCDLRKPVLHKSFSIDNRIGLSGFLTGQNNDEEIIHHTDVDNLFLIPSGPIPPTPVELLAGDYLSELLEKAYEQFDIVIIDSPPVIGISDALILAQKAEATLFTVACNQTKKPNIQETFRRLCSTRANILGSVFTKVKQTNKDHSYYYYYHDDNKKRLS
jgi:capsular exopolysaccharide synthesis family protein